jgi:hypothetical protein
MMTRAFILFATCWSCLQAREESQRKFNVAISLGEVCQPAGHLHASGLRRRSFPFDWLITPFEGLMRFIANEGKGFLKKENLLFNVSVYGVPGVAFDAYYCIYPVHALKYSMKNSSGGIKKYDEVVVNDFDGIKATLERRIERFFDVLRSNKKVLFVRLGITYKEALRLDELLHTRYPRLDYVILALDDTHEMRYDWGLKRVRNFYIKRPSKFDSHGEDWKRIFALFPFENMD